MRRMKKLCAAALAILLALSSAAGLAEKARNITDSCRFRVNEGSAAEIVDDSWGSNSAWTPNRADPELGIMLPKNGAAAFIQIDWVNPPTNYTLTEYAEDQSEIATHTNEDDGYTYISQALPLHENTRYVFIRFNQRGQGISRVRLFSGGTLPYDVAQWQPPHEKCDLMVVSTHQDDEWLWFGGIIPYYDLVQKKKVQVVYMANCGRYRYGEALNGLAVSGVRTYPLFIGLPDRYDDNLTQALNTWHGKEVILEGMVGVIRQFKPEVILTHDWNGEYGHPQHILTSRCMEYAIEAAADPNQYPESAEKYGAWQVKKLYRHLEEKGRIEFDWHKKYDEFGGHSGLELATAAMNQHASQLKSYQVQDHGRYDNALFGLSYSVVGNDEQHKDLFENVPESTPEPTATATSEPTPTPTATQAPTATPEPFPELTLEPAANEPMANTDEAQAVLTQADNNATRTERGARQRSTNTVLRWLVGVGLLAVCGGAGAVAYTRLNSHRRHRHRHKARRHRK